MIFKGNLVFKFFRYLGPVFEDKALISRVEVMPDDVTDKNKKEKKLCYILACHNFSLRGF